MFFSVVTKNLHWETPIYRGGFREGCLDSLKISRGRGAFLERGFGIYEGFDTPIHTSGIDTPIHTMGKKELNWIESLYLKLAT